MLKYEDIVQFKGREEPGREGLYRVTYTYKNQEGHQLVDVKRLDDESDPAEVGEVLASELKRVPDPRKKLPPIENMPEGPRPECAFCARYFQPQVHNEYKSHENKDPLAPHVVRRVFKYWRSYRGLFCTTGCAIDFAEASYRGGYRRQQKVASKKS